MKQLVYFTFILLITACANDSTQQAADCAYGEPRPIFSDTLEAVQQHQFSSNKQEGTENVLFVTGLQLEVLQSGCEAIEQEFQFTLDGDYREETPEFWLEQATLHFQFLGSLGEQYFPLYAWGQAIGEAKAQMKLGEPHEVQPHFNAIVDKVVSKEQATLIIRLAQQAAN